MGRRTRHAIVGVICAMACGGGTALASGGGFTCPSPSTPVCTGQPNYTCSLLPSKRCTTDADCLPSDGTCTIRISGTATASSPRVITSIVLASASNVSISASVPPSATSGTFAVTPTAPGDGQGIVVATDDIGATCTVDVSFRTRAASVVADEEICPQFEGYSFRATSAVPSSQPAGVSACASRLATCSSGDNLPGGYEYQNGAAASRLLFVRSPIAGEVVMSITKHSGGFESNLSFFLSRSANLGVTYGAFVYVAGQITEPGSTRIRGTGQWSDVRVVTAVPMPPSGVISLVPAWADWAKVVVLLLMLMSIIAFAWRQATKGDRTSRHP